MENRLTEPKDQLRKDGYCIFTEILDEAMLGNLREVTNRLLAEQTLENKELYKSMGSNIPIYADPIFAELIAWPNTVKALASLGYPDPKCSSGYIISKPPKSPRLFWHYDYMTWESSGSFEENPQVLFLMYYLVDTTPHNGCLRVIPGSHLQENRLHTEIQEAHSQELTRGENLNKPEFTTRIDEVNVPIKAGDLLIGDARLLHATHENNSNERRTCITLWYYPDLKAVSEPMQAFAAQVDVLRPPDEWTTQAKKLVEPFIAKYEGTAAPLKPSRKRPKREK
jgi:hypothetical protein